MTWFLRIVIILLLALATQAQAQSPSINIIRDTLKNDGEEAAGPVIMPEPADLTAGWWQYFLAEGEELDQRVQDITERLERLPAELPPEVAAQAAPHIELFRANVQALPQARAQKGTETPAPVAFAESYSLNEMLDLARRQREALAELGPERNEVAEAESNIKSSSRAIDTLMAAYLSMEASNPTRVLRGLEIMAERSALAVAEERLRLRRAELAADEVRASHLSDELEIAGGRLQVTQEELRDLEQSIDDAEKVLDESRDRHIKEQAQALAIVADTPEDRAAARYREQRVLRAAVLEAIAEVRLIKLRAQRDLTDVLLEREDVASAVLRGHLSTWQKRLGELRVKLTDWIADSERERGRTGDALAGGAVDGTQPAAGAPLPVFIQLINQDRFNLAQETLVATRRLQAEIDQADLLLRMVEEQLLVTQGRLADIWARIKQALAYVWAFLTGIVSASLFKVGETPVTALGLLRIVVIVTAAWWISYWLRKGLIQLGERGEGVNMPAFYTIARLSHYVIIVIGFIVGLSSVGVDFTNFALVAGAVAIGIGFGLQSIVNNFVSGLILLFERSLKVGDFVELASGVQGEVREINVRSTLINTNDNVDIVVPNSEFMNTQVVNWTLLEAYRRIHLPFRVAYGTDKELVRQAILEAADKLPHTMTGIPGRNPAVWLKTFGENCYEFELVVWLTPRAVKRPQAVTAAYMWEIDTALKKHGIKVPFPQRDIHLKSGFPEGWGPPKPAGELLVTTADASPAAAVSTAKGSA